MVATRKVTTTSTWGAPSVTFGAPFITLALFNADGSAYVVTDLPPGQEFRFELAVPNCTAAHTACTPGPAFVCGACDDGGAVSLIDTRGGTDPVAGLRRHPAWERLRPADNFTLLFWNDTLNDWDSRGVRRDNAAIAASGDNCTFIGYTSHFTSFTIGALAFNLNVLDPDVVRHEAHCGGGGGTCGWKEDQAKGWRGMRVGAQCAWPARPGLWRYHTAPMGAAVMS